jgi:hypothetical protein
MMQLDKFIHDLADELAAAVETRSARVLPSAKALCVGACRKFRRVPPEVTPGQVVIKELISTKPNRMCFCFEVGLGDGLVDDFNALLEELSCVVTMAFGDDLVVEVSEDLERAYNAECLVRGLERIFLDPPTKTDMGVPLILEGGKWKPVGQWQGELRCEPLTLARRRMTVGGMMQIEVAGGPNDPLERPISGGQVAFYFSVPLPDEETD